MKVRYSATEVGGIDDSVGQHFGRVRAYTIIDLVTNEVGLVWAGTV